MNEEEPLKMFVWEHVLKDYTDGLMVALAHDAEEARALLKEEILKEWGTGSWMLEEEDFLESGMYGDLLKEPEVYETPKAVFVNGGG